MLGGIRMSVESRMDEFEKVSDKKTAQDVSRRMQEFEQVDKSQKYPSKDKSGTLPYGIKRLRPCPECGETMEIHEIKEDEAVYHCKSCGNKLTLAIEK